MRNIGDGGINAESRQVWSWRWKENWDERKGGQERKGRKRTDGYGDARVSDWERTCPKGTVDFSPSLSESFICASVQLAHFYARSVHTCHLVSKEEEEEKKGTEEFSPFNSESFISFIYASIQLCPFQHEVCSHTAFSGVQNRFPKEKDYCSLVNYLFLALIQLAHFSRRSFLTWQEMAFIYIFKNQYNKNLHFFVCEIKKFSMITVLCENHN